MKYLIAILGLFILPIQAAEIAGSFTTAKRWAEKYIYHDRRITFYCGCSYTEDREINQGSCGYVPRTPITKSGKENIRDNRLEWEHVFPMLTMGNNLQCWSSGRGDFPQCVDSEGNLKSGRACCQKVNDTFKQAHNDLVNMVPAIGEVNANRLYHPYGIVDGEPRKYGACDFEVENKVVEPAPSIRGDIARIQLYMLMTYGDKLGFTFDPDRLLMFQQWAGSDPISDWELERNRRICAKQGSSNPLVSDCHTGESLEVMANEVMKKMLLKMLLKISEGENQNGTD